MSLACRAYPDTGTGTSEDLFSILAIKGPTRGEGKPGIEPGSSDPQSSPLPLRHRGGPLYTHLSIISIKVASLYLIQPCVWPVQQLGLVVDRQSVGCPYVLGDDRCRVVATQKWALYHGVEIIPVGPKHSSERQIVSVFTLKQRCLIGKKMWSWNTNTHGDKVQNSYFSTKVTVKFTRSLWLWCPLKGLH